MESQPETCSPLDPVDWEQFRLQAHALLDRCLDRLAHARDFPWRPVTAEDRMALELGEAVEGQGMDRLVTDLVERIMPFATGNTHPRFFGWVHGTGLAVGVLSEMVAATMNSNCGGRDHGAVYVEREVINWCRRCFGLPEQTSGILVAGTSQATVIALACARQRALGAGSRAEGIQGLPRLTAYAMVGVHNALIKALELLGLGGAALRTIPCRSNGGMDLDALSRQVAEDRLSGLRPFCVIGTAGSVDLGLFDDLSGLADFCAQERIWLHVDGAFGAWARLADAPWRDRVCGIERADSLALDFHKWMYVQYDCGVVLIREEADHRAAFAARPAYLAQQSQGVGSGEPWYCDYGIDLSRGFRALKVWSALRAHGSQAFGEAISRNCRLAMRMAERVTATAGLRLVAPVTLNICCFSAAPEGWDAAHQDGFNTRIVQQLQLSGEGVFSTTRIAGLTVLRAAIVNHRTCEADIDGLIAAVAAESERLLSSDALPKLGQLRS
ncbi:MAG: amino acid decarboxylase [Magnetococcales bacterium]|nr:amino acid decarboxylase [Magnetococcales bacterium]NGZ06688.1 amino acid decarboxylase [Magnetococcales bacterium]